MTSELDRSIRKLGDGSTVGLNSGETVFRLDSYEDNPIVKPQDLGLVWHENERLHSGAVFNGGAEMFENKVILLPRCHQNYRKSTFFDRKLGTERTQLENYISEVWPLESTDGVNFSRIGTTVIRGDGKLHKDFTYGIEDIRIIKINDRYFLIGCGKVRPPFTANNADRIAIYSATDTLDVTYHGMVGAFDSRNAVPFPEHVSEKLYMLFRFNPNIYLDHLEGAVDQLLYPAKYRRAWDRIYEQRNQNLLLKAGDFPHEKEKIGPSTQLIKTHRGWLLIYHAVGLLDENICEAYGIPRKIDRGYSICAAILDINEPGRVICRASRPIYIPSAPYELYGSEEYPVDVPAVVFPVGAIVRDGKLVIYAGAGDKYTILLSCDLGNLIDYLWQYCRCEDG